MPDRNTRWANDKEWIGWTIRDEIYGYVREHWLPTMMAAIIGGAGSVFSFIASHLTLAAWLGAPTLTILIIVALSWIDGRRRRMIEPGSATSGSALPVSNEHKPQPHVELSKKNIPPETREALDAMASALHGRPVETEPGTTAVPETPTPPPDSATAAESFERFNPPRPMLDLADEEWIKLGTLYDVYSKDYAKDGTTVIARSLKLKFLPDVQTEEYALLLLLHGYRQIYQEIQMSAEKLEVDLFSSGCRKSLPIFRLGIYPSNLNVDEVARSSTLYGLISEKFGLSKGGFYRLTDRGIEKTRTLFEDLVRRA